MTNEDLNEYEQEARRLVRNVIVNLEYFSKTIGTNVPDLTELRNCASDILRIGVSATKGQVVRQQNSECGASGLAHGYVKSLCTERYLHSGNHRDAMGNEWFNLEDALLEGDE